MGYCRRTLLSIRSALSGIQFAHRTYRFASFPSSAAGKEAFAFPYYLEFQRVVSLFLFYLSNKNGGCPHSAEPQGVPVK